MLLSRVINVFKITVQGFAHVICTSMNIIMLYKQRNLALQQVCKGWPFKQVHVVIQATAWYSYTFSYPGTDYRGNAMQEGMVRATNERKIEDLAAIATRFCQHLSVVEQELKNAALFKEIILYNYIILLSYIVCCIAKQSLVC